MKVVSTLEVNGSQIPRRTWFVRVQEVWQGFLRHKFVYLVGVILPVVLYAVFVGYPIIYSMVLSFFRWDGINTQKVFIGLQNYRAMFADPNFYLALINTAKWTLLTLLIPVIIGFILAMLLATGRVYFANLIRSLFFFPTTMSLIMIGAMFALILNPIFGAFNTALGAIGLGSLSQDWLGNPQTALYTLILTYAWSYLGLPLTMFFAGIRQIPDELFETAQLEGANLFHILWYIAVPLLKPVFTIVVVLSIINSVRAFDLVFTMTRGGPFGQSTVLGYYMYTQAFLAYRYGYGATLSVAILVISALFAFFYLRTVARESLHG